MSAKYTLICHDKHPVSTITVEIETCSLNVLVSKFENFLRICGYHFDGKLDFVEEDLGTSKVLSHMVNQLNANGDFLELCEICKVPTSLMKTHKCWDEKCPQKKSNNAIEG